MANLVCDYAKGRWVEKATLPLGTDNLIVVLLKAGGLPSDTTIKRNQYLSGIFTAGGVEATFTNYTRQVLSAASITIVVNTSTDVVTLDISDQVWSAAGGASNDTLGAFLTCYRPTSSTLDSGILVLTKHDFAATTTGGNLTAAVPSLATAT